MLRFAVVIVLVLSGLFATSRVWGNPIEYCMKYRGQADLFYVKYENELDMICRSVIQKINGVVCSSEDRRHARKMMTTSLTGAKSEAELLELLELAIIAADTGMSRTEFAQTAYLSCLSDW